MTDQIENLKEMTDKELCYELNTIVGSFMGLIAGLLSWPIPDQLKIKLLREYSGLKKRPMYLPKKSEPINEDNCMIPSEG